jgi:hypothetical protein
VCFSDLLDKGGLGVAIIPVSCVISPNKAKSEILEKHTLKAVMSMSSELFYPVGTVTCIVISCNSIILNLTH